MKTGIVLNISDGKAQVLLAGGKFRTVRAREGWQIGDLVLLQDKKSWKLKLEIIGAAIAVFGFLFFFLVVQKAAVLSLDVNPSIEFVLNRIHQVIDVQALNEEGQECIDGLKLKYKNYINAVTQVLRRQQEYGYLENDSLVVVTIWTKKGIDANACLLKLQQAAFGLVGKDSLECYVVETDLFETAKEYNVTAGKYFYLKELKKVNANLSIQAYCDKSIAQLKEELKNYSMQQKEPEIEEENPTITIEPEIEEKNPTITIEPEIEEKDPTITIEPEWYQENHHGSGHHRE